MPEDRKLAHAVQKAVAENQETANLQHLHISAVSGAVFLDGEVESAEQRATVLKVVKAVEGVKLVRDRLQINPQARGGGWKQEHQHEA
jgi:osmotically-inducible protein OsmY